MPRKNQKGRELRAGVALGARHKAPFTQARKFEPHRLPHGQAIARLRRLDEV